MTVEMMSLIIQDIVDEFCGVRAWFEVHWEPYVGTVVELRVQDGDVSHMIREPLIDHWTDATLREQNIARLSRRLRAAR